MKKLFLLLALFVAALLMVGCEENMPTPQVDTNEYYVKYTIKSSFYKFGHITYADVHGTGRAHEGNYANTSTNWSVTIGPVKKGFHAFVQYDSGSANSVTLEVSKNNGPFVLKASGTTSAFYTIDF